MTEQHEIDPLTVSVDERGTIVVRGEVDIASGPLLDITIRACEADGPVSIDLTEVTFMDSTGLRALLNASRRANDQSTLVTLRGVGPVVRRLFEITGTADRFTIEAAT